MLEPNYWPPIITGAAGLIGTIIGAIAATSTQFLTRALDKRDARKSLAFGLAAEIESYISLMERRNHIRTAEQFVNLYRQGHNPPLPDLADDASSPRDYFPIFRSNVSAMGSLGATVSKQIAAFHREVDAVRATAEAANRGEFQTLSPLEKADLIEQELEIWRGAMNRGKSLVTELYAL